MKQQYTDTMSVYFDGEATFNLISRLLAALLAEGDDQLVVTAKSENFIYDETIDIGILDPVSFRVTNTNISKTGLGTELSMNGELHDTDGFNHFFSLYFFVNLDVLVFSKSVIHMASLRGKHMMVSDQVSPANLHDALFSLSLRWGGRHGSEDDVCEGRGYLVFARESTEGNSLKNH